MGHQGITTILRGQNERSINMSFFGIDQECKEYEWKHE